MKGDTRTPFGPSHDKSWMIVKVHHQDDKPSVTTADTREQSVKVRKNGDNRVAIMSVLESRSVGLEVADIVRSSGVNRAIVRAFLSDMAKHKKIRHTGKHGHFKYFLVPLKGQK